MNRTMTMIEEGQNYYELNKRRIWVVAVFLLFVLLMISFGFATKTVTAKRSGERVKQVTSIEIQKGDTLWSIASKYMSDEYSDLNAYIKEIKVSNGMTTDVIHSGNYIIVPYYEDAI